MDQAYRARLPVHAQPHGDEPRAQLRSGHLPEIRRCQRADNAAEPGPVEGIEEVRAILELHRMAVVLQDPGSLHNPDVLVVDGGLPEIVEVARRGPESKLAWK